MKFTSFQVWQVVVPAREDIITAPPGQGPLHPGAGKWPAQPVHLVEGTTDSGLVAVGECGRGTRRSVVEATLADLLGRDLTQVTPATIWMQPDPGLPPLYPPLAWEQAGDRSYVLMESLWYDAVGKAAGLPAYQLMGGAVRPAAPTGFWANRPPAATLAGLIQEAVQRGFRNIKLKSDGRGDTAHSLVQIAQDVPYDFSVTIDPMTNWRTLRESGKLFQALAQLPFPVQIEDPFPHHQIDDWVQARRRYPLPLIFHARNEALLRMALREEMMDGVNLGGGSVASILRMGHAAEFAGLDCWQGSSLELGVLQHVRLHASLCLPNCVMASDLQSEWVREATLITPRMQYEEGCALPPAGPGLGVALDHQAMAPYVQTSFTVDA